MGEERERELEDEGMRGGKGSSKSDTLSALQEVIVGEGHKP